ncbi:TetR/AcrR family transcriptional regulator [Actinosynnema sp. NPDC047251]|uniref:HTH tetR-type domain-containing protein n=1 Tax=Saccharothrix espanaensis (strain ATCC 51144 / DSM 44229 / JCM 9112 / NBRC 15066 / NRRL 15764) TaxID=1179773 RepID=K0K194_SACES|nr:TetR/AcrR family transcriptional regulator [Saccharothrix espanaensis]CCH31342.1 hypothetical protein BN6_40560 [Saccharothrix espanaensis DSM 44229]
MNAKNQALQLLWGDRRRPSRGPQRGLSMDRIVAVAIEVAETEGLAALSMRRVATALGVGTASLYTYLPGKAELEALMLDAIGAQDPLPDDWPGDWRAKLEAWARADWVAFRAHPWTLRLVSTVAAPGPNMLRWMDSALAVLADTGLTEAEKMAVIESVDAYVRGLARQRTEDEQDGSRSPDQTAERNRVLGELVDFTQYPSLLRVLQAGVAPWSGDQFEFGLQRLLDGIQTLVESRANRTPD